MAMRMSSVGHGLVIAGGAVAVVTVAAIATGTQIVLTPAMIQLLIFKGLAAAAVGLIVVGSWLGRRGRQHDESPIGSPGDTPQLESGSLSPHESLPKSANPAADTIRSSRSG